MRTRIGRWVLALAFASGCGARPLPAPPPAPPAAFSAPPPPATASSVLDQKVEALLARMNLDEKIGQLVQLPGADDKGDKDQIRRVSSDRVGSVLNVTGVRQTNAYQKAAVEGTRLGIPLLFGFDVIHGYKTIYPIPLAEAASFDPSQAEADARMAAVEASAAGVRWTFAPMVDIARDARWGRIAEGSGEDPYLGARFAAARVRGFQRDHLLAACAKHFVGYGAAEAGRDYNTADMSERVLRDVYLPPFQAAVDAGVDTVMSAFNDLNGTPASANRHTLTDILRTEWGFRGFVVSDWGSIEDLIRHGVAADSKQAAREALLAGVDMDMASDDYHHHLASLVAAGEVPAEAIDTAVRRILRIKFELGLFDAPFADPDSEDKTVLSPEHLQIARRAAERSIVLLKNEANVLPLRHDLRFIALVGPLADDQMDLLGAWSAHGAAGSVVSLLSAVKAAAPGAKVLYAKGCGTTATPSDPKTIVAAVNAARTADAVVLAVGETFDMSGEAASRATVDLPGRQEELVRAVIATGRPVVVVLMNGRPLAVPWIAAHAAAIVEAWHLGVQAGPAIAAVLFGDVNPAGRLPVSFPRTTGQVPIYYDHENTGRPAKADVRWTSKYLDVEASPLYPFGFGLSYSAFEYGNLRVSSATMPPDGALTVSVDVKNASAREGEEVVQLYVHQVVRSLTQPVKELRGFERVSIAPGATKTVTFALRASDLGYHTQAGRYVVQPGAFELWVGPSSTEGLKGSFTVR